MRCANCGDEIDPETDTLYEQTTPVQGGGQTRDAFCSVSCLNEDVGFTDEEIESLMRQAGYEVPTEHDFDWGAHTASNISNLLEHSAGTNGEFFILFEHTEKDYDVELFHEPQEQLYQIVLYEYDVENGEKVGYDGVRKEQTGMMQRALKYAENFMASVEEGD